jgi:hypothetical protein
MPEVLQLCRYPVVGWPDASPALFGWRLIQVARFEPKVILLAAAGICAFRFPTLMWRSRWTSRACAPTTSLSGCGSNVTPQKFSADCDRVSDRAATVGGWTETYIRVKDSGLFVPGCRLDRCDDRLPSVG